MATKSMKALDLNGKTVVMSEGLNLPMKDGKISNDKRISVALPTLKLALEKGAGVIVISYLGCPTEGEFAEEFFLKPMEERPGEACVLENARFNKCEKKNSPEFCEALKEC